MSDNVFLGDVGGVGRRGREGIQRLARCTSQEHPDPVGSPSTRNVSSTGGAGLGLPRRCHDNGHAATLPSVSTSHHVRQDDSVVMRAVMSSLRARRGRGGEGVRGIKGIWDGGIER